MADRGAPYCHKFIDGGRVECWAREIKHFIYMAYIFTSVYKRKKGYPNIIR